MGRLRSCWGAGHGVHVEPGATQCKETARNAENRALQCIVVSDCCTAGEREVHDMTIQ